MIRVLALCASIAWVGCGGRLPETHYYQLATTAPARATGTLRLAIASLDAEPPYDDERIAYRTSPYRLDFYNYHRWSAPPGTLVARYLDDALARRGLRIVTGDVPVLGGRLIAFEEVDRPDRWFGRIVVELVLSDPDGRTLWSQRFEQREPAATRTPEGIARALSVALGRIVARAAPAIEATLRNR